MWSRNAGTGTVARKAERPQRRMQAARAIQRIYYDNYGNNIIVIIIISESLRVQPVVTVADQRAGWTGTDPQLVRFHCAGHANMFIVMEDGPSKRSIGQACGSAGRIRAKARRIYAGG